MEAVGVESNDVVNSAAKNLQLHKPKDIEIRPRWQDLKFQLLSTTVISFSMVHAGISTIFPNLLINEFTTEISSKYASISALSTPLGSVVTSSLTDRIGRKRTLIIINLLCVTTWIMVVLSKNVEFLFYCSSVFTGITRGALTSHCSGYISEISHSNYRQMFLSFTTLYFTFGCTITSAINIIFSWEEAAIYFAVYFVMMTVLTIVLIPESPHWLGIIKLDLRKAKILMKKLNPTNTAFNKEWALLEQKLETRNKNLRFALIRQKNVYKPSCILIALLLFQQFCGTYPLSSYTLYILPKINNILGKTYSSEIFAVIGVIRLFIAILTTAILSKFNQKQLLSFSAVGMLLAALPIVAVKNFVAEHDVIQLTDWLLVICFSTFIAVSCVGAVGIPWTIIFELLPIEARGFLGPYFIAFGYVVMSGTLRIFPTVVEVAGVVNVFIFFSLVSAAGALLIHFYVPETKGRSLYEIENRFSTNVKLDGHGLV